MRVAVVMGSVSDLSKVEPAILILKEFGVKTDVRCLSAHRAHHELCEFINEANEKLHLTSKDNLNEFSKKLSFASTLMQYLAKK